jgi:hypothetical protein
MMSAGFVLQAGGVADVGGGHGGLGGCYDCPEFNNPDDF